MESSIHNRDDKLYVYSPIEEEKLLLIACPAQACANLQSVVVLFVYPAIIHSTQPQVEMKEGLLTVIYAVKSGYSLDNNG